MMACRAGHAGGPLVYVLAVAAELRFNAAMNTALEKLVEDVARAMAAHPGLFVLGICGAQGSGKSTLTDALATQLRRDGVTVACLSLDDLYLTRAEREHLARAVHPLLRTRGVPGTHDLALGLQVLERLARGEAVALPRFDKARDDRAPETDWPVSPAQVRILILEGWCVGARPQQEQALAEPVNAVEAEQDADGRWRHYVNKMLAGDYQRLFGRIDRLLLLAAPGFEVVGAWRQQQEQALRAARGADGGMSDAEVLDFIRHYERLTRHILEEMPARADMTLFLDQDRQVRCCQTKAPALQGH